MKPIERVNRVMSRRRALSESLREIERYRNVLIVLICLSMNLRLRAYDANTAAFAIDLAQGPA